VAVAVKFLGSLEQVVLAVIDVMIVVHVPRGVPDKFVEASFGRPRSWGEADVPFPEAPRRVGRRRGFKDLRNEDLLLVQPCTVVPLDPRQLVVQAVPLRNATRQEAGPRHRAGW